MVRRKNAELADLAETAAAEAERLLANAKRALRKARADAAGAEGERSVRCGCRSAAWPAGPGGQRSGRAAGGDPEDRRSRPGIGWPGRIPDGATRQVSLHDPDARPIRKGRLGKPVEFGHKAQVCDNEDGIVLDHDVLPGNPADAPRLLPRSNASSNAPAGNPKR